MSGSGSFTLPDTHRSRAQLSSGFGDCTPFVDRFDSRKREISIREEVKINDVHET
jgi:hypothetical protein